LKFQSTYRSSSERRALLTLENEVERALSDSDLLLIVDNRKGIRYAGTGDQYELTGEGFGKARHFGGHVERAGDSCRVVVYID
jgi:hypothetical protein